MLDIFPAEHADNAIRLSLFDDEVESRRSDPLTGHIRQKLALHGVPVEPLCDRPAQGARRRREGQGELAQQKEFFVSQTKLIEAQRIEQRTRFDIEMMLEIGFCKGIENYSRHLSGRAPGEPPPTLVDYLPSNALAFIDESHVTIPQVGGMYRGDRARKAHLANYGFRLPSALDNRPLRFDEFEQLLPQTIFVRRRRRTTGRSTQARSSNKSCARRVSSTRCSTCGRRRRRSTICCPRSICGRSRASGSW